MSKILQQWGIDNEVIDRLKDVNKRKYKESEPANIDSDFVVPKGTKNYWGLMWLKEYNKNTGVAVNKPFIVNYNPQDFNNKTNDSFDPTKSYSFHLIHDPSKKTEMKEDNKKDDLEDYTRVELMEKLEERGISYSKIDKKEELIEKLK